jgi:hypothetical protein
MNDLIFLLIKKGQLTFQFENGRFFLTTTVKAGKIPRKIYFSAASVENLLAGAAKHIGQIEKR